MTKSNAPKAWWHFGHAWMVVLGPAIVVVASFVTFYLAAHGQDPVLNTDRQVSAEDAEAARNIGAAPAMQARNHAAAGIMPEVKDKK